VPRPAAVSDSARIRTRTVTEEDVRSRRRLTWRIEEDMAFAFTGYLPPEAGAVALQAIRAALGDLEHPPQPGRRTCPPCQRE